jgi:hydrogenase expression/formation protein HypC
MCLALPMRIRAIDGAVACCEAGGVERDVDLYLLQEVTLAPGDFVLVHVGYAIQKVDPQAAHAARALHDSAHGDGG